MNGEKEFETPVFNEDGEFNKEIITIIKKTLGTSRGIPPDESGICVTQVRKP